MERKIDKKSLNKIAEIRIIENLTLKEIAAATGLSESTVSRIEKGTCIPNHLTMLSICAGLHKNFDEVFITDLINVKFV